MSNFPTIRIRPGIFINRHFITLVVLAVFLFMLLTLAVPLLETLGQENRAAHLIYQTRERSGFAQSLMLPCHLAVFGETYAVDEQAQAWVQEAINQLEKARRSAPYLSQIYLLMGDARCLLGQTPQALDSYQEYIRLRPKNPLGYLKAALAIEALCVMDGKRTDCSGSRLRAEQLWGKSGVQAQEAFLVGEETRQEDQISQALFWYEAAVKLDPQAHNALARWGNLCQKSAHPKPLSCSSFLSYNSNNWFVDPSFRPELAGEYWKWNEKRAGVLYDWTSCPDIPEKRCAHIVVEPQGLPGYAGYFQGMMIQSGAVYRYSVWVRASFSSPEVRCRGAVLVGRQEGKNIGLSLNLSAAESQNEWTRLDYTFTAPPLDQNLAYLYPVLLESPGEIWFYEPSFVLVSGNNDTEK